MESKEFMTFSEACVRINGVKSDWFIINSGVRKGCVMSPWLFNLYMDGVMKELKVGVTGNGVRMMEMSGGCPTYYMRMIWFCVANLKSLRELVERFGTVCKRRDLKVNVDKSKVMVVSEDSPQCEVTLDGEQLEQVSEFKYLGYVLDEKGTDDAECSRKVVNGRCN